jgi:hypothetical protein
MIGFFFINLLGLIYGEPTVYMCSLYGTGYATIYECLSRWSNGPRNMIKTIFRLVFHFLYQAALVLGAIIFLFMQAIAKAIGWFFMTAMAAPNWSLRRYFISTLESLVSLDAAFGFVFLLQWKTWAIAIPACWMLYLEVHQMAVR